MSRRTETQWSRTENWVTEEQKKKDAKEKNSEAEEKIERPKSKKIDATEKIEQAKSEKRDTEKKKTNEPE